MANYMQRLIDKTKGRVKDAADNISPFRKIKDAIKGGGESSSPKRSTPIPPEKRKKIKPKGSFR